MPRSGTTLLERILSGHPAVQAGGELTLLPELASGLEKASGGRRPYPRCLEGGNGPALNEAAGTYAQRLAGLASGAAHVTDKLPGNFIHLGLAAALAPSALILHCRRDPRDTCWSAFTQLFGEGNDFTFSLHALGRVYRGYERLMDHWDSTLPAPIFDLDYEQLIARPEETARALFEHCGLDWHPECLEFAGRPGTVSTASELDVRRPLHGGSIGRWQRYRDCLQDLEQGLREY